MQRETIAAIATPAGSGRRAVIRISGPAALAVTAEACLEGPTPALPGRYEFRVRPAEPSNWPWLAVAVYVFRGPRSYTGEDVVELHLPGLKPFLAALLRALGRAGARNAEAGEFTRRAFLNRRLDLTQAEAVLALTSGERESEARLAARTLAGGLRGGIDQIKDSLLGLASWIEAGIDFSEDDIELMPVEDALRVVRSSRAGLRALEERCARLRWHQSDPVVLLRGAANAGKSTLFNRMIGQDRTLTAELEGTTRDSVEAALELPSGRRVRLLDSAGEKKVESVIEDEALTRARDLELQADVILRVVPATQDFSEVLGAREILVRSKSDLVPQMREGLIVSARCGGGVERLLKAIDERLGETSRGAEGCDFVVSGRQLEHFDRACQALDQMDGSLSLLGEERWEFAMVDLREALNELGAITGAVATDDILDAIFGRFCIGK